MRVAYVCADAGVPVFGHKGCSIHVQEIVRSFIRRGDQVELFVARTGGVRPPDFAACRVHEFALPSGGKTLDRECAQCEQAGHIAACLRDRPPFELVYERYSLWSSYTVELAEHLGTPSVLEVNAPLIEEQQEHRELIREHLARRIAARAFSSASTLIAVSAGVADYLSENFPGVAQRVRVVPNGVDVERFTPAIAPIQKSREFTIGFLGSLKPWHGLESLLAAFELVSSRHPTARLRIIGDGPLRAALAEQVSVSRFDLDRRVEWIGAVPPELVPGYLTSLDVAVAPYPNSRNFYFSPLKVYEYMAAGRTVVASAIGQLGQLIEDRVNGCLYSAGDSEALAECLLWLADHPDYRSHMGMRARQTVVANHSWTTTLETIVRYALQDQAERRPQCRQRDQTGEQCLLSK